MTQNNLLNLINPAKVINKGEVLKIDPDKNVKEEMLETNTNASVFDATKPSDIKKNNIKKDPNFLSNIINDDISVLHDTKEKKLEKEYLDLKKDMYPTDNIKTKHEIFRNIKKMEKDGSVLTEEVNENDTLEKIERVHKDSRLSVDKLRKTEFIWNFVWLMCFVFENIVTRFGYGIRFNGWSDEISHNKNEYLEYIKMMVSDYNIYDEKLHKYITIKNKSALASLDISPTILLLLALLNSAVSYTAANNYGTITEMLNKKDDQKNNVPKKTEEEVEEDIMKEIEKE